MSEPQFLFSLKVSDQPQLDAMLQAVAKCMLERAGYAPAAIADILATFHRALDQRPAERRSACEIQFRAEAGELQIVVSDAGREWRVARALPD